MALAPQRLAPTWPRALTASGTESIAAAAEALYRACHLPRPAVLVARDGAHFARLACDLSRVGRPGPWGLAVPLGLLAAGLAVALSGRLDVADMCGVYAVLATPWMRYLYWQDHRADKTPSRFRWQMLLLTALGASVLGAVWLIGAGTPAAVKAT